MTDTKMFLFGAITLIAVTISAADKQNVSVSLSLPIDKTVLIESYNALNTE